MTYTGYLGGLVVALMLASPAAAQLRVCENEKSAAVAAVDSTYSGTISEMEKRINEASAKGVDPNKFPYFDDTGTLRFANLNNAKNDLITQRGVDRKAVTDKVHDECNKDLQPIQDIVSASIAVATLGISEVIPKHFTHVDVSQIATGKPLGGDSAFVPKLRDDVLDAIGIGGKNNEIGKVVRDPVRVIRCIFGC